MNFERGSIFGIQFYQQVEAESSGAGAWNVPLKQAKQLLGDVKKLRGARDISTLALAAVSDVFPGLGIASAGLNAGIALGLGAVGFFDKVLKIDKLLMQYQEDENLDSLFTNEPNQKILKKLRLSKEDFEETDSLFKLSFESLCRDSMLGKLFDMNSRLSNKEKNIAYLLGLGMAFSTIVLADVVRASIPLPVIKTIASRLITRFFIQQIVPRSIIKVGGLIEKKILKKTSAEVNDFVDLALSSMSFMSVVLTTTAMFGEGLRDWWNRQNQPEIAPAPIESAPETTNNIEDTGELPRAPSAGIDKDEHDLVREIKPRPEYSIPVVESSTPVSEAPPVSEALHPDFTSDQQGHYIDINRDGNFDPKTDTRVTEFELGASSGEIKVMKFSDASRWEMKAGQLVGVLPDDRTISLDPDGGKLSQLQFKLHEMHPLWSPWQLGRQAFLNREVDINDADALNKIGLDQPETYSPPEPRLSFEELVMNPQGGISGVVQAEIHQANPNLNADQVAQIAHRVVIENDLIVKTASTDTFNSLLKEDSQVKAEVIQDINTDIARFSLEQKFGQIMFDQRAANNIPQESIPVYAHQAALRAIADRTIDWNFPNDKIFSEFKIKDFDWEEWLRQHGYIN